MLHDMHKLRLALHLLAGAVLCGCAGSQYVTGESRGYFDTAQGMYGGNEFDARSTEGSVTYANQSHGGAAAPAKAAAPVPAAPAASATSAASIRPVAPLAAAGPAAAPAAPQPEVTIAIDGNAFSAVFGAAAGPLQPSAEQLMRLDSLALVAADAARVDLQTKILACRRAGERCRLTHP